MASQEQVKGLFIEMNMEQKDQFIDSLKRSIKANNSAENIQLLDECMALYKKELGAITKHQESDVARSLVDNNTKEALYMNSVTPPANTDKIGNIDMRISELYDNIQRNMGLIETISLLLSGIDNKPYDVVTHVKKPGPVLSLERVGDYEKKINFIEEKFAEVADSVRNDMGVIEAISSLLSVEEDHSSP